MATKKKLTPKEKIFCEEYVIDWNATRAAKVAGYSEKTAKVIGYENLTKPYINEYIEEIQKDLSKLAGVSALRNIQELKKIAYSNLHNYQSDWMSLNDWGKVSEDDKAAISEVNYNESEFNGVKKTIVKFKLHDKQKAIESLNKMLGFNAPDKVDLSTKGKEINREPLSDKLVEKIIDKL